MKYIKWMLSLLLVIVVCAIGLFPSIRIQLGIMSDEDRKNYTINNGDIGHPINTDLNIKDINGKAFEFTQLKNKNYYVILASKGCPGCNFLVRDYKANKTITSAPLYVIYFDKLTNNIIRDPKIHYLLTYGNRNFTYFDSVFTPTIYQVNAKGIVTEKFIGYSDEHVKKITH